MPDRPSDLWKGMPPDKRVQAADAFWRDSESPDIRAQHLEAAVVLARRLKFRPKSIQSLPIERRARHLAQIPDVSESVATRALIAYHFSAQRPLMGAFLDALGIEHEEGLITAEDVPAPDASTIGAAATAVKATFPAEDVDLYLRTLAALDRDTWGNIETALSASA
jgi:hypothetical protein